MHPVHLARKDPSAPILPSLIREPFSIFSFQPTSFPIRGRVRIRGPRNLNRSDLSREVFSRSSSTPSLPLRRAEEGISLASLTGPAFYRDPRLFSCTNNLLLPPSIAIKLTPSGSNMQLLGEPCPPPIAVNPAAHNSSLHLPVRTFFICHLNYEL